MALSDAQLAELYKSGHKYRRELLAMPLAQLAPILGHMTLRTGIRGKESVGELETDAELAPYTSEKRATDNTSIELRELETYLGDVVKEFDPHVLSATVYGNEIARKPTETDIVRAVALRMAQRVSNNLAINLFTASRNASGKTTKDLFDGFITILDKDITAGRIADANGNLADVGELTRANIVDKLMEFYQDAACDELQDQQTKLFLPRNLYNLYHKGYQDDFGSAPFNKEYKKTFLEGTDDRCELVPMSGMKGAGRIILTIRDNMLVGVDQQSDSETVRIRECDNPKMAQFFMKLFFGVQLESISKQRLLAGKFTLPTPATPPEQEPDPEQNPSS